MEAKAESKFKDRLFKMVSVGVVDDKLNQGYDILTYFVNLISRQGDDWPSALGKRREAGLQADFLFSQVEQGGFANEAVRRIIYEPDFTIRLVR